MERLPQLVRSSNVLLGHIRGTIGIPNLPREEQMFMPVV
jgi:hypothetical protein